ncbi:hypothetical protein BESB_027240 [Besnoitia besnoiti]|uniref:Transmembrane protein n=1 Tax=Besnoitia besnoiti TaxID=94643 RepID=A0A2A9M001_BESBE|nr:uncharacterized protein BESB_027240 [Besnoitia besnoiti]PFH31289.1 hypothetical protein BESB_027240 [Besnoitia besnoiti]
MPPHFVQSLRFVQSPPVAQSPRCSSSLPLSVASVVPPSWSPRSAPLFCSPDGLWLWFSSLPAPARAAGFSVFLASLSACCLTLLAVLCGASLPRPSRLQRQSPPRPVAGASLLLLLAGVSLLLSLPARALSSSRRPSAFLSSCSVAPPLSPRETGEFGRRASSPAVLRFSESARRPSLAGASPGAGASQLPLRLTSRLPPRLRHTSALASFLSSARPQDHFASAAARLSRASASSSPFASVPSSSPSPSPSPRCSSAASSRCPGAHSSSSLSFLPEQPADREEAADALAGQLPEFSFDFFEETPEPPPLASHGPEDSPTIHVPGVWYLYLPRWLYASSETHADALRGAELKQGGGRRAGAAKGKEKRRKASAEKAGDPSSSLHRPAGCMYTPDPDGICGRKGGYDGPEAAFFFEDHTAVIPSLSARGNWALVDPPKSSPLLNKELRLCIFSGQVPQERLLLRGLFAFAPRPTISLWDERVQLHAAQLGGSVFVQRNAQSAASGSATGLPLNVQVCDNAGNVVLGAEEPEAVDEEKKHEKDDASAAATFQAAGDFTAYRLLGEDENYFNVHHHFIRYGPKRLYRLLEPDAPELGPRANAVVETLLAPKSPVALHPSAAPIQSTSPSRKGSGKGAVKDDDKRNATHGKDADEETQELRLRLEAVLREFAREPPEEVIWPVPRLPKRSALEEDEEAEE